MDQIFSPGLNQPFLSIQSLGLYGYLNVDSQKPENSDLMYDKWIAEN